MNFLDNRGDPEGETIELTTPEGISCRFSEPEKPSISIGGGLARPQIVPGLYGREPIPARLGGSDPVAGVVLRVPFGGSSSANCDELMAVENAKTKYQTARMMFEDGLIDEEQLRKVAAETFKALN